MRPFGATPSPDGTTFRLWAPSAEQIHLLRPGAAPLAMNRHDDGVHEVMVEGIGPGSTYMFRIGTLDVPDPASRAQAEDATGWSVVVGDLGSCRRGSVRPWHEAIIAEVHVGAASPEGTFAGLEARLDHFAKAGYTVIELLPLADFAGRWNWGYDGVLPYAPDSRYGSPQDLRRMIDAAHALGIAIMIDVVYNHFGPAGGFLQHYAAEFFTPAHETPWGPAIALDDPMVRAFFAQNVRMWMQDYDVDGLRFDAVHAFRTDGVDQFMELLADTARSVKPDAFLILENDDNAARWLERRDDGRPRYFTAQWNDDFHHVFYVARGGEVVGHYADYSADTIGLAARTLAEGFVYQGETSRLRGTTRGEPSAHLPPESFVSFVQNHDQIGNRPMGDRMSASVGPAPLAAMRFLMMMSPHTPLFFMGEEAAIMTPFPFFCDFAGVLAEVVRKGRREEFRHFFETHPGSPEDLPDPLAEATFLSAKLPWDTYGVDPARSQIETFRWLAELRRTHLWPLAASRFEGSEIARSGSAIQVRWRYSAGSFNMALNPSDRAARMPAPPEVFTASVGRLDREGDDVTMGPWTVAVWTGSP